MVLISLLAVAPESCTGPGGRGVPGAALGRGAASVEKPNGSERPRAPREKKEEAAPNDRVREYQGVLAAGSASFGDLPLARVRAAALRAVAKKEHAPRVAPLSLTASDGSGLMLVSLRARAVIEGPLAFTELHLTFRNPEPRQLEGRFSITLPDEAAVSRFAMRLGDAWQEAEVVERQAAQEMYEEFLHRRQDPALLEKKAGNEFSARIFPIPAKGDKEIKISYSQELRPTGAAYRLPLKGLPRMERLQISALVGRMVAGSSGSSLGGTRVSREAVELDRANFTPGQDFEVPLSVAAPGLRHENLVVARVRPEIPAAGAPVSSLLVLMDTSASRAAGFAAQVEVLGALVKALAAAEGDALTLQVACFDQTLESIYRGQVGRFSELHLERILARQALGASNLAGALAWAAGQEGFRRVLLVSDGVATAGRTGGADLRKAVSHLGPSVERLDVLLVGGIRDESLMGRLARGTLRVDGAVLDGDLASSELVRRLRQRTVSGIEVEVPGARWVWPSLIEGAQPGNEYLIYADVPQQPSARQRELLVRLTGPVRQTLRVPLAAVERPLLERAWVKANISRLAAQADSVESAVARDKLKAETVALSTRFRVLSDYTALLVLETEEDYQRFGLERRALGDILTVGPTGLEVQSRSRGARPPRERLEAHMARNDEIPSWIRTRGDVGLSRAHRGDEGRTGARAHAARAAAEAGVLGILGPRDGARAAHVVGRASALGADARDPLAGLVGNQIGESYGVGGLGLAGAAGRGRSSGARDVTLGTLGTIGRGGGGSNGAGYGRGSARLAGRRARTPSVMAGRVEVRGSLDRELIRRVIRRHLNEVRTCYQRELQANPALFGRVTVRFTVEGATGQVTDASIASSTLNNTPVEECVAQAVRRWRFPTAPVAGTIVITYPFVFRAAGAGDPPAETPRATGASSPTPADRPELTPALSGRMAVVAALLRAKQTDKALLEALDWRAGSPGDTLALVALGEALQARGWKELAARAYGSLIDLYPARADLRRFAGERLEALGQTGLELAADTYSVAVSQRPDHLSGYRLLAYALVRQGKVARAFETLERALAQPVPGGRFRGVHRVLRDDLGMVAAAWLRADPRQGHAIKERLGRAGAALARAPSLRFVLTWETDANDVDLHVYDGQGNHAYYDIKDLPSGGALYEDVTTGYGPECFAIDGKQRSYPYRLMVHYYSQGPMGYGMGKVEIVEHDGHGKLRFEERPFVVMHDQANLDLGTVRTSL
jgi:TonB family protein